MGSRSAHSDLCLSNKTTIFCLQETSFSLKDTHRRKVKGWRKRVHASGNQKRAGLATLLSATIDCQSKPIKRDKEGHCIVTKGSTHQEDVTIVNTYAPNTGVPKHLKHINTTEGRIRQQYNNSTGFQYCTFNTG